MRYSTVKRPSCVEEYRELSLSLACSDVEGKLLPDQCYVAVDGVALPGGTEIVVARFPNRVVTYHYHDMCGSTSCVYFARKCGGTK